MAFNLILKKNNSELKENHDILILVHFRALQAIKVVYLFNSPFAL